MKIFSVFIITGIMLANTAFAGKEFVYKTTTENNVRYVSNQLKKILGNSYMLVPGSIDLSRYLYGVSLVGTGVTTILGQQLNHYQVKFQVADASGNIKAGQIVLLTEDVTSSKAVGNNETSTAIMSINGYPKGKILQTLVTCSNASCDTSKNPSIADLNLVSEQ